MDYSLGQQGLFYLYIDVIPPLHQERFPFLLESNLAWGRYKIQCWGFGSWEEIRKIGFSPFNIKTGNYSRNTSWLPSADSGLLVSGVFGTISPKNNWVGAIGGWISKTPYRLSTNYFSTECFILPLGYSVPLTIWLSRERMHCTSLETPFSDA